MLDNSMAASREYEKKYGAQCLHAAELQRQLTKTQNSQHVEDRFHAQFAELQQQLVEVQTTLDRRIVINKELVRNHNNRDNHNKQENHR